jgi:hypothetical protein
MCCLSNTILSPCNAYQTSCWLLTNFRIDDTFEMRTSGLFQFLYSIDKLKKVARVFISNGDKVGESKEAERQRERERECVCERGWMAAIGSVVNGQLENTSGGTNKIILHL